MKLLSLLLAPALALCGTYSGTVVSLDGTPVAGAVIKGGADSVTTTPNGSWTLARAVGIAPRSGGTVPVTSHLTLENGHPRLSFGDMDISGRTAHKPATGQFPSNLAAARSQEASDTLRVYWKGKRITVLPVPADSAVTFRIDTTWKDDAGIPWNPRIAYASMLDARNHFTYRTVSIGNQTWMAENLDYAVDSSWMPSGNADSAIRYGRLYNWSAALALDKSCQTLKCNDPLAANNSGICPNGWQLPDSSDWSMLDSVAQKLSAAGIGKAGITLKATSGWVYASSYPTKDLLGFRALSANDGAGFWSRTEVSAQEAAFFGLASDQDYGFKGATLKKRRQSVRCLRASRDTSTLPVTTASPSISPAGGIYTALQTVTLYSATSGAIIYYTTDGSTPTASSSSFTGTIKVSSSRTIKAIAVNNGVPSAVSSATYSIFPPSSLAPWNISITYGNLTDSRDGHQYRTVLIGAQTWMAENLNFAGADGSIGSCHNGNADSCVKYGRIYAGVEVLDGASPSNASPSGIQGICPTGWHVPSDTEWSILATHADSTNATPGKKLKSTSGWYNGGSGTDSYGFRALASGNIYSGKSINIGTLGLWWSTTAYGTSSMRVRAMSASNATVNTFYDNVISQFSLRCVKDTP